MSGLAAGGAFAGVVAAFGRGGRFARRGAGGAAAADLVLAVDARVEVVVPQDRDEDALVELLPDVRPCKGPK
jgi:hypothetical protein